MSKEFKTIGVNTDPLSVQLYFDENNSIKWKIIFKDSVYIDSNQNQNQNQNQSQNQSQNKFILNKELEKTEHILTNIFPNIFIIGSKNRYDFKYNEIPLELDETPLMSSDIDYNTFDHLKYNKIIGENLNKNISWKHYIKSIKTNTKSVDLNLDLIELSQINSLIEVISMASGSNLKECLVIFGDFSINTSNLSWYKKNKDKYELSNSKIVLLWYTSFNSENNPSKKLDTITNFKSLKAFVIISNLYNELLKKLNEKKITWESCLYQLIEQNQLDCYQISNQIFSEH